MKQIDDYLSGQAQKARNSGKDLCCGVYGDFIQEDCKRDKRDARRKGETSDYVPYDWDADKAWWDARDALMKAQSRGGGTTDHDF